MGSSKYNCTTVLFLNRYRRTSTFNKIFSIVPKMQYLFSKVLETKNNSTTNTDIRSYISRILNKKNGSEQAPHSLLVFHLVQAVLLIRFGQVRNCLKYLFKLAHICKNFAQRKRNFAQTLHKFVQLLSHFQNDSIFSAITSDL